MDIETRIAQANAVIDAMASHGRRFFAGRDGAPNARFLLAKGHVRFSDDYLKLPFDPTAQGDWPHFSHGGTLRSIVEALTAYVMDGDPVPSGHFGPWPSRLNGGDLWGYGTDAMASVRSQIAGNPAIAPAQTASA